MIDVIAAYLIGVLSGLALYQPWRGQRRRAQPPRQTERGGMTLRDFRVPSMATVQATPPPAPITRAEEWRLAITVFAFHGNMTGFSYRSMSGAGICRRAAWEAYSGLMRDKGILVRVNRVETAWAPSWGYPRFRVELRRGVLALPYPLDVAPPPLMVGAATQTAQHSTGGADGTERT